MEHLDWEHYPRVKLGEDMVLSAERWTLNKATVERLRVLTGPERYLAWRRQADAREIPNLVYASFGGATTEVLFHADGRIAVEFLFRFLASGCSWLRLTELPADFSEFPLQDADGQHYCCEIAVSWKKVEEPDLTSALAERNIPVAD